MSMTSLQNAPQLGSGAAFARRCPAITRENPSPENTSSLKVRIHKPSTSGIGQVISAEWDQFLLPGDDMNATALQTFQIDIPCILKRHSRNAQRVAADPFKQTSSVAWTVMEESLFRIGVIFPVLTHIFHRLGGRALCRGLSGKIKMSGGNQFPVFSQHGEPRKGAMGFLSTRGDEIFRP
jgi:hypothetical protein